MIFGIRKLESWAIVRRCCVILRLAVLIQYRSVTDRHTTTAYTALSIASRGKNERNVTRAQHTGQSRALNRPLTAAVGAILIA